MQLHDAYLRDPARIYLINNPKQVASSHMPRFGGIGTRSFTGALINNALGSVANAVLPRSVFGGFGSQALGGLGGQQRLTQNPDNRRAILKPKPAAVSRVLGNGLLNPLKETGGMIWPYTPSISSNMEVDYQSMATVHANQDFHVYSKTPAVQLQVNGDFTVQNQKEGQYAMAAIHFLRTVTKMNFGENDPLAGTPPPVLLFSAYGPYVFHNLPVIVKGFQIDFPDSVDYVQVQVSGSAGTRTSPGTPVPARVDVITTEPLEQGIPGNPEARRIEIPRIGTPGVPAVPSQTEMIPQNYTVWLPSQFKISAMLIVQHTPKELRSRFNLNAYRDGALNQSDFI
jgi:hypothetical protein